MSNEEREPSAEEIAEAEALARALEKRAPQGAAGSASAPEDALAAAAFLRRAHEVQSAERRAEESRRLAAAAARAGAALGARRAGRLRWSWLGPAVLVPAAAVLLVVGGRRAAGPPGAPPLPAPPLALLEAQARAASGRADLAALDRDMRAYRETLYATLAARASSRGGP